MDTLKVIYKIPVPYSMDAMIEVYGEPENAWYEWRVIEAGKVGKDTGREGEGSFRGRQYGSAEIALRDALIDTTR